MRDIPLMTRLKEMILSEELAPGARVTEAGLAEKLGISRTPVRNVLPRLAAEGFLKPAGRRGFAVAAFSEKEIWEALELRSVLEGWAARQLAEHGANETVLAELEACLAEGDRLFEKRYVDSDDEQQYGLMNERFHRIIVDACDTPMLGSFLDRLNRVPFVAPSVIVFDQVGLRRAFDLLFRAHGFHHAIVEAIREGDGQRAEMLFREHAKQQRESLFARRAARQAAEAKKADGGPAPRRRKKASAALAH